MSEPRVLVIDRTKWRRGGDTDELTRAFGPTALLNDEHMMCCLGFSALACGVPEGIIVGHGEPCDLDDRRNLPPEYLSTHFYEDADGDLMSRNEVAVAITINDRDGLTDAEREAQLIPVLKELGWDDVQFIN
jgi:hypothetical protein